MTNHVEKNLSLAVDQLPYCYVTTEFLIDLIWDHDITRWYFLFVISEDVALS